MRNGRTYSRTTEMREDLPWDAQEQEFSVGQVLTGKGAEGGRWSVELLYEGVEDKSVTPRIREAVARGRWAKAHNVVNTLATKTGDAEVYAWARRVHDDLRWLRARNDRINVQAFFRRLEAPPTVAHPPPRSVPKVHRQLVSPMVRTGP